MHISKWFEFILEDVISNDVDCQLSLLKELLHDNDFFINNFVNQDIVAYLTSCFTPRPDKPDFTERKYLEIFRLFCISGKKVNTQNQKLILDHFLMVLHKTHSIFEVQLGE